MSWKIPIIILLVVVGIILTSLYFFVFKGDEATTETKQMSFKEIIESCKKIEYGLFSKNYCIKLTCDLIGAQEEKIQECMKIDENSIREKYIEMGMEPPEITEINVNSARDSCFFEIVPRTIETCTKISYIDNRDNCLMYIEPIIMEVCDSISESTRSHNTPKDSCYNTLAQEKIDDSICDKINHNTGMKSECYMNVGILKKDPKVCEKINDSSYHLTYTNRCIGAATNDISKCGDKITAESKYCYIDIAKSKNDLSICDMIESENFKANCYREIADLRNDSSLCDKEIIEEDDRDSCYLSAADKLDESFCETLSEGAQINCYSQLAKEKGDLFLCNKILESGSEMMFYYCYNALINSASEKLNKNFNEEDKVLYDKCCQIPYDCEDKNKTKDFSDPRCGDKRGEYELRVYDSQGNVTGLVNGEVKLEIPRSFYFSSYSIETEFGPMVYPAEVIIFEPNDTYVYEIFGVTEGNYNFQESRSKPPEVKEAETITISPMAIYAEEGEDVNFIAEKIPISPNVTHQYHFDWDALIEGKNGTTILIDNDNDKIFEKNITVGLNITCEEFITLTEGESSLNR